MAAKAVLLLSDGKPGHFQLAEGIVAALVRGSCDPTQAEPQPWSIVRLPVERTWWQPTRAWSGLTNSACIAPERALSWLSGKPALHLRALGPIHLIVSAGGDTLAANVAARRMFQCPNIFYGSLRRYQPDHFSLVLTSYERQVQQANQAMTLKPSAFDPDTLRVPRAFGQQAAGGLPVVGLLVGGDSGTVRFGEADWAALIDLLGIDSAAQVQWVVANSRRTPLAISDRFAELAARNTGIEFIDVRTAGAGTLRALFDRCDAIAVTVDSSSMVSEAVWSRRPVVVLAPSVAQLPPLEAEYRAYLASQLLVTGLDLKVATLERLIAAFAQTVPLAQNPLDALARLIQTRLPELYAA